MTSSNAFCHIRLPLRTSPIVHLRVSFILKRLSDPVQGDVRPGGQARTRRKAEAAGLRRAARMGAPSGGWVIFGNGGLPAPLTGLEVLGGAFQGLAGCRRPRRLATARRSYGAKSTDAGSQSDCVWPRAEGRGPRASSDERSSAQACRRSASATICVRSGLVPSSLTQNATRKSSMGGVRGKAPRRR